MSHRSQQRHPRNCHVECSNCGVGVFSALVWGIALLLPALACAADAPASTEVTSSLPDSSNALHALFRMMGAMAVVLAVFLGGVWLYRNWQRVMIRRGGAPRLNIYETRSLGNRHALHIVGYENQRLLISSSPGGITFLTHLPASEPVPQAVRGRTESAPTAPEANFAVALRQMLVRKPS